MNILNKFLKYLTMKQITNNLGKVVEEDNRIVCYVKETNNEREYSTYYYRCHGINDSVKDLAKKYDLNKPITYIFDGLEFMKNKVVIYGYNDVEILIRNCCFNRELIIANPKGTTVFENTIIKIFLNLELSSSDLTFKNMDIASRKDILYEKKINVLLYGDNIQVINSKIGEAFEKNYINIDATNKLSIVDSKISGEEVEIKSKELMSVDSLILATEILAIDSNKASNLNIKAPVIIKNEDMNLTKEELERKEKNKELLKVLKHIKNQCEVINNSKIEEYKSVLNSQEVSKVLKKTK